MDIYTTKPVEEVDKSRFKELLSGKEIIISNHALDHLSEHQRKIFKDQELINILINETPRKIYLQQNGRYATYHRKPDGYRKLIFEVQNNKIIIVSFMDTIELPKIRFENE